MPTRNVVRVPHHVVGVVKAALFPPASPASGINLDITTAKEDSPAATALIIARGGGGGNKTASAPNKEGVVRNKDNVEVDLEAAPDTSSAAAVHHTVLRKDFESALDYLEAKYVKSIVTDNAADEGGNGDINMNQSQSRVEKTTTMVTRRTVVRINSSGAKHCGATSAVAGNKSAAIKTTKNKQSELSKCSSSPAATSDKKDEKKKCSIPLCRDTNDQATVKRQTQQNNNSFVIDLSDVPHQPPILKQKYKDGASKYTGVHFINPINKWQAQIWLEGKYYHIGSYEDEEQAAVDYARAVFKYKGVDNAKEKPKKRQRQSKSFTIDLSDVPPQPPIPKQKGRDGASKYTGVHFHFINPINKWQARIWLEGKYYHIGSYEDEEQAAVDYARAVFKYKGVDNAKENQIRGLRR